MNMKLCNTGSIQRLQQENQASSTNPCPACGCDRLNVVLEKPPNPHYASARCGSCDCFRFWVPKPQTLKCQRDQREAIERLLGNPYLSDWERSFCQGLLSARNKKLSPKQLQILSRIVAERGGVA